MPSSASDKATYSTVAVGNIGHGTSWAGFAHTGSASTTDYALVQNASGKTYVNCATGQHLQLRQNNSPIMTLDDSKVGIGTTDPSKHLHIYEPSTNAVYLQLSNSTS